MTQQDVETGVAGMPDRDVTTIRDAKSDAPTILDNTLTPEQKQAITHDKGPLLVIAGPGSGKTEVMIRRATNKNRQYLYFFRCNGNTLRKNPVLCQTLLIAFLNFDL